MHKNMHGSGFKPRPPQKKKKISSKNINKQKKNIAAIIFLSWTLRSWWYEFWKKKKKLFHLDTKVFESQTNILLEKVYLLANNTT